MTMSFPEAAGAQTRNSQTNRLLREAQAAVGAERQRLIDEVIVLNVEVARSLAGRYRNRGVPVEDLEQVACVALVRAAGQFDPRKADDFLTYAVPTMRGEVKRYFRDHGWTVRPPRRVQEIQTLLNHDHASQRDDESPGETAARLGVEASDVSEALAAQGCFQPTSLDATVNVNTPIRDMLVDDQFDDFAAVEARAVLRTLTMELEPRERLILYLRFVENRSQKEIGEEIGVTQMQVSRLLTGLLDRMRKRMVEQDTAGVA
jgi:RNA polymerase sigma-B factor